MSGVPVRDFMYRQGVNYSAPFTKSDLNTASYASNQNYSRETKKYRKEENQMRQKIELLFGNIDGLEKYVSLAGSEESKMGQIGSCILEQIAHLDREEGLSMADLNILENIARDETLEGVNTKRFMTEYGLYTGDEPISLEYLTERAAEVKASIIETMPIEKQIKSHKDYWFLIQLKNYAVQNGGVLTGNDITELSKLEYSKQVLSIGELVFDKAEPESTQH